MSGLARRLGLEEFAETAGGDEGRGRARLWLLYLGFYGLALVNFDGWPSGVQARLLLPVLPLLYVLLLRGLDAGPGAARAALVESQSQYRRSEELFRTRVVSESELEQLGAQRDADEAAVEIYTVVRRDTGIMPVEPPFVYGVIKLDGADTGLVHIVGEVTPEEVKEGMRVKAVFEEERTGKILDVKYFKPV